MGDAGNKLKALSYIADIHAHSTNLNIEDELNYYAYINTIYMTELQDFDHSLSIADTMMGLLEQRGYRNKLPVREVQIYNIKGDALVAKGLFNEAYDYYYQAKSLATETSDSCSLSTFSYNLGMVTYRQQKFAEAAYFFKESFEESHSCLDIFTYFYKRQELLDNIALCYDHVQQYDSAMVYFKAALSYIEANKGRFKEKTDDVYIKAEAVIWGNIADVYIGRGQMDSAKAFLDKSIALNLKKGYANRDAEIDQIKLAGIYLQEKKNAGTRSSA